MHEPATDVDVRGSRTQRIALAVMPLFLAGLAEVMFWHVIQPGVFAAVGEWELTMDSAVSGSRVLAIDVEAGAGGR